MSGCLNFFMGIEYKHPEVSRLDTFLAISLLLKIRGIFFGQILEGIYKEKLRRFLGFFWEKSLFSFFTRWFDSL